MGNVIDNAIFKMIFDNEQFERAAQTTLQTLANLEKSLNFSGVAKGVNLVGDVAKTANSSFGKIGDNIEAITKKFSTGGIAAMTVTQKVVEDIYGMAKSLLRSNIVTKAINQMQTGGMARAQNLEQAKFQLEGLGQAWEDVKPFIDKAVNDTAYGMDEAAKVASQLVASNVQLGDEMQYALSGISGVASMTNSSYGEIGHIFTTIAGQGKVMTEQLNMFASRGLNVAAELAKAYNVDEATLREMVSKGQVDFKTFSKAMYEAFGEQATKANETFSGAMSNMKAALSRIGAEFATPWMKNMRDLFNAIRPKINSLKELLIPFINRFNAAEEAFFKFVINALNNLDLSPLSKIVDFAIIIVDIVEAIGKKAFDIWKKVFPNSLLTTITKSSKALEMTKTVTDKVTGAFGKFVDKINGIVNPIKKATEPIKEVNDTIDSLANKVMNGDFGNGEERRKALEDLGYSYEVVQNKVNELMGSTYRYEVTEADLAKMNKTLGESNADAAESFSIVDKVAKAAEPILEGLAHAIALVADLSVAVVAGISPLGSVISNIVTRALSLVTTLSKLIAGVHKAMAEADTFGKIANTLHSIFTAVANVLNPLIDKIFNFGQIALMTAGKIAYLLIDYKKYATETDLLSVIIGRLIDVFTTLRDGIVNVYNWFSKLINTIKNSNAFKRYTKAVDDFHRAISELGINILIKALDKLKEHFSKLKIPEPDPNGFLVKLWTKLRQSAKHFETLTDYVKKFNLMFQAHGFAAFGIALDKVKKKVRDFISNLRQNPIFDAIITGAEKARDRINKFLAMFNPNFQINIGSFGDAIKKLKEGIVKLYEQFKIDPLGTFKSLISKGREATSREFGKLQGLIETVVKKMRGPFEKFYQFLNKTGILPAIKSFLDPIVSRIEKFIAMFKEDPEATIKIYFRKITNAIKTGAQDIQKKLTDLYEKVKDIVTTFVTDFKADPVQAFKNLFERIKEFVSSIDISSIVETIKQKFTSIFKLSKASVDGASEDAGGFVETIMEIVNSIVGNIVDGLKKIDLNAIGNLFDKFPGWFKTLAIGFLAFRGSSFVKSAKEVPKSLSELFKSLTGIPEGITEEIKSFGGIFTSVKDLITGLKESLTNMFDGLDKTMKSYRRHLAFKNLLYMAASVALIAASIIALAQFPQDKIITAGIIVVAVMGVLTLITKFMGSVSSKAMIGFGVIIASFAAIIVALTLIPIDQLIPALGKFIIAGGALVAAIGIIGAVINKVNLGKNKGLAVVSLAASILMIAGSMVMLADIPVPSLVKAGAAVVAIAGVLTAMTYFTSGKDLKVTAGAMLGFAGAIDLLTLAFIGMNLVSWDALRNGVVAIGAFGAAIFALTKFTNGADLGITAAAMIGFAIALDLLMGVFLAANFISWDAVLKGGAVVGIFTIALIGLGKAMELIVPPLATLLIVFGAVAGIMALFALHFDEITVGFKKMWDAANSENGIITKLGTFFGNLGKNIKGFLASAKQKFESLPIVKGLASLKGTLKNAKGSIINLGDAFSGLVGKIKDWGSKFAPVKAAFDFLGGIKAGVFDKFKGIGDALASLTQGFPGNFLETISAIPAKLGEVGKSLYDTFIDGTIIGKAIDGIKSLGGSITEHLSSAFGGFIDIGKNALSNLAQGFMEDPANFFSNALGNIKTWWLGEEGGDGGVWGIVKGFGAAGLEAIKKLAGGFGEKIAEFFTDPIGNLKKWWLGDEEGNGGVWGMIKGFGAAGIGAIKSLASGFVDNVSKFFSDPIGTLKTWWLGEEGGDGGIWGMIKGFGAAGIGAIKSLASGFIDNLATFFSDPVGALKDWWLGKEGVDGERAGGVWGIISGFGAAGKAAISGIASGFKDNLKSLFEDPVGALKTWWLGEEGNDKDGVWGMVSGFLDAGKAAVSKLASGFKDFLGSLFEDPVGALKTWWLGDEKDEDGGGVWGMVKGFADAGGKALSNLVSGWTSDENSVVGKAFNAVKGVFFGADGKGGVFGWADDMLGAGKSMIDNLIQRWNDNPTGIVTSAFNDVKKVFFGENGKGGVFGWAGKTLSAGADMVNNLIQDWTGDSDSPIAKAFNSVASVFFGEDGKGGVFGWAGDMLSAGTDAMNSLLEGVSNGDILGGIKDAAEGVGNAIMYGGGSKDSPGAFSIMGAFNTVKEGASGLLGAIKEHFEDPQKQQALLNAASGIGDMLSGAFKGIGDFFQKGIDFFDQLINGFSEESQSTVGENGQGGGGRKFDEAINNMVVAVGAFSEEFGACGSDFFKAIGDAFNGDTDAAAVALSTVGQGTQKIVDKVKEAAPDFTTAGGDLYKAVGSGFGSEESKSSVETSVGDAIGSVSNRKGIYGKIIETVSDFNSAGSSLMLHLKKGIESMQSSLELSIHHIITLLHVKAQSFKTNFQAAGTALMTSAKTGFESVKDSFLQTVGNIMFAAQVKAAGYADSYSTTGSRLMSAIVSGLKGVGGDLVTAVENVISSSARQAEAFVDDFEEIGAGVVAAMAKGASWSNSSRDFVEAIGGIAHDAYQAASYYEDWFDNVGANMVGGLARGVNFNYWTPINAIANVAYGMLNTVNRIFDINSPSKEFAKIGKFADEGLGVGLLNNVNTVTSAVDTVGNSALMAMGQAIADMSSLVDDNMDTEPVIRPVMDMSDIIDGFGRIGNMANSSDYQLGLAAAGIFQTGSIGLVRTNNSQMLEAMGAMQESISRLSDAVYGQNDAETTMTGTFPIYLDGEQIGSRTADFAIQKINRTQLNKMRVAGR